MFVKGKGMWGHIDGSSTVPTDNAALTAWETKDAQVISWILGSIEPQLVNNLRSFSTAKAMWDYLKQLYNQDNAAKRFQLELDIANYKQGDMSIQDYYSGFLNLWAEHSAILHSKVPTESLPAIQAVYEVSKRDQFLMKLRPEYEAARAALLNRHPVPSLEVCVGELLREEQRLLTQGSMSDISDNTIAYSAQGQSKSRDMRQIQCFSCKQFGHIARNCTKKFCNYCKQRGHIITECPTRPAKRPLKAFTATAGSACPSSVPTPSDNSVLTTDMVQQVVLSALSALGITGKSTATSSPWFVDSGASNHMTGSPKHLHNVHSYNGTEKIQIADGNTLSIAAVGDINSFFRNVLVSPGLSSNLISVGQLVDTNCDVHFSRAGCLVQDQVSKTVIAKGPKVGRLFPLQFTSPSFSSFVCNNVPNTFVTWHKKLGHPNSIVLSHLIKSGLIGNKNIISSSSLPCSVCKLAKSKTLPFPSSAHRADKCFDIIHSDVWGVSPVLSHAQYKYFVTFIDDYSRYTWVYFLRSKAEVFTMFKTFLAYVHLGPL
uniref:Retrovirus-related Pol polyprotein from transposon TNT 1-94 n=1 Tax=Cajanus cajan TaxID=3821 RepID=A0A151SZ39_CAJCA|nr:Retrovirus-related Pol polyprotein from transposon TNT 1-94 [Cajanus cajan]